MADVLITTAISRITSQIQSLSRNTSKSTLNNPKLARLRRKRNRLVTMLMFCISGVATSCMPEFARCFPDGRDPWAEDDSSSDQDEDEDEDDGLYNPIFAGPVAGAGAGTGTNGDDGATVAMSPPSPALGDDADDWINDALTGGGYISQALSTALIRSQSRRLSGPPGNNNDDGGEGPSSNGRQRQGLEVKLGDGKTVKLTSHPREVRRLIAVFEFAWKTVLKDLDLARAEQFLAEREKEKQRLRAARWESMNQREDQSQQSQSHTEAQTTPGGCQTTATTAGGPNDPAKGANKGKGKQAETSSFADPRNEAQTAMFAEIGHYGYGPPRPRIGTGLFSPLPYTGIGYGPIEALLDYRPHPNHPGTPLSPAPMPNFNPDVSAFEAGRDSPTAAKTIAAGTLQNFAKSLEECEQLRAGDDKFNPFTSDRAEIVANFAARKINKIGKRIVRRVQLDKRVIVARNKLERRRMEMEAATGAGGSRERERDVMRTGSSWRMSVR